MTPTLLDHAVPVVIVGGSLIEWRWYWPRVVRNLAGGVPGARLRAYRNIAIAEWVMTFYIIWLWIMRGRPGTALGLVPGSPLRLGVGVCLAAIVIALLWFQRRAILAKPERIARVRERLAHASPLIPRTSNERLAFSLLSITAGVCEEFVFRGFLMWYFAVWTGPLGAALISSAIFGFGHIYLGLGHVPRTALVGLIMAVIVLLSGSLWPAIVIHAALDLNSGDLGFRALSTAPAGPSSSAAPA
jgi:membrane protease YdiL (CAAX protease family)